MHVKGASLVIRLHCLNKMTVRRASFLRLDETNNSTFEQQSAPWSLESKSWYYFDEYCWMSDGDSSFDHAFDPGVYIGLRQYAM